MVEKCVKRYLNQVIKVNIVGQEYIYTIDPDMMS